MGAPVESSFSLNRSHKRLRGVPCAFSTASPPRGIPPAGGDFTKPVFDWRQLQRWKVSERALPPGSEIRFRQPGLWEQYHWVVIAALTVVLIQAAMISWLLFERRRRRLAELESRRRIFEVAHLNRAAAAGALSASIAHELNQPLGAILSNAESAELLLRANPLDAAQRNSGRHSPSGPTRGRHHHAPASIIEEKKRDRLAGVQRQ